MRHLKGQATYDSQAPEDTDEVLDDEFHPVDCLCGHCPEDITPACDPSWCADCIAMWEGCENPFITAADMAEAKDEIETERLEEIIKGGGK